MRKVVLYTTILLISLSMLLPFFLMLILSFTPEGQVSIGRFDFTPTLGNWLSVFDKIPVARYFLNSFIVAGLTAVGQVIFSAMAGFVFARMEFKGRDFLFYVFLLSMMVPPQVNIVPLFWVMSTLGLVNTYPALILPGLFGGFGVFMMRQFFLGFPAEVEEAARIDGAGAFRTFFTVVLPLAAPAVATLGIFTFVSAWNSFMWPLIVTNTEDMRTLALGLAIFKGSLRELTLWGEMMVCCTICTIPAILIFLFGKKYLINDIAAGAFKELWGRGKLRGVNKRG